MKTGILSLGKQTIIYGLGDAVYKAVAFFLLPVYLKYLSPYEYGTIESLMVTRGLVVTLVAMGLPNAVFRFYYRAEDENERKQVVSTIFFLGFILQIIAPILFWWKNEFISNLLLKQPELGFLISILALNIFLSSFRGIPLSLLRAKKKAFTYTAVNLIVSIVTLLMNIYFVAYLHKGVLGVLFGNLCGGVIGLLVLSPYLLREIGLTFNQHFIVKILTFSVPLALALLPLTVIFMADRYFIVHFASLNDLGIYALGYKLGSILKIFIIMPFALAWAPFVFSKEKDDDAKEVFSRVITYFVMISLTCVVAISVTQVDIIKYISKNSDYWAATSIVPIICYAFFFYGFSHVIRLGTLISGKTYYVTIIMCCGLFLNLILNYFFVNALGYRGACYALLVTFLLIFYLSYFISQKLYHIDYDLPKIASMVIMSIVFITVGNIANYTSSNYAILIRIILIVLFIFSLYIFYFSSLEKQKLKSFVNSCVMITQK